MPSACTVDSLCQAVTGLSASRLQAQVRGDGRRAVARVASLEGAGGADLAFLANPRYREQARQSGAGALVLSSAHSAELFPDGKANATLVICDAPYAWFAFAAQVLAPAEQAAPARAPSAHIAPAAQVHAAARIDAHAVIEDEARIEAGAWVGAGCFVGRGAQVGAATRLHPGVRIYAGCRIGARCIVHSGAVIGADGFGFASFGGAWVKIPQTGVVVVGDEVEIGANSTIDRGSAGDTTIGRGVKIDNQVQIGHNCHVGEHTAIAGCVGIAGSTTIGRNCQLGGASMINGHISIADGTIVGGGSLVLSNLRRADVYSGGFPLMRNRDWERNAVLVRHLVELRERIRLLEADAGIAPRARRARDEPTDA